MQRNKSYLKIGEFIVLYVRKGQTSEIVFVLNTPNGWLFTNKVYHLLLLMNKLGRETNELESLDIKREDGHQPNKKTSSPTYYHVFGEKFMGFMRRLHR